MKAKLTARFVESAPLPLEGARDLKVFDSQLTGFGLRVYKSGRKVWFVQYRSAAGTDRKKHIGDAMVVPLSKARMDAKALLLLVEQGKDPVGDARLTTPTVAALLDAYIEKHAKVSKKPRSLAEDEALAKLHIKPQLGSRMAATVTGFDIEALRVRMKATPTRFGAARALLSHAFNLAIRGAHGPLGDGWGVSANPCAHVPKPKAVRRGRVLTPDEWRALGGVLATSKERPPIIAAIRLLALTGARRNEILCARYEWIEANCLRLPDSKTGPKVVALPAAAVEVIKALRALNPFAPWLIPGVELNTHATDLEHPWQRIRKAAGLTGVRLHDLRHSFISTGGNLGIASALLQRAAGHANASTTERYLHIGEDPVAAAAESIGASIAAHMAVA